MKNLPFLARELLWQRVVWHFDNRNRLSASKTLCFDQLVRRGGPSRRLESIENTQTAHYPVKPVLNATQMKNLPFLARELLWQCVVWHFDNRNRLSASKTLCFDQLVRRGGPSRRLGSIENTQTAQYPVKPVLNPT